MNLSVIKKMDKANIRQKKAFKEILENNGKLQPALKKAGYSKSYAKNPHLIKRTKGWKSLIRTYLPDIRLIKIAKEGLEATMVKTSLTEPDRTLPDYAVRHRYLETALKMKGRLIVRKDYSSGGKPILQSLNGLIQIKEAKDKEMV